jgi:hypothetical protein
MTTAAMIVPTTPIRIIIFMFCQAIFRFKEPALCSNCEAPICSASEKFEAKRRFRKQPKKEKKMRNGNVKLLLI